MKKFLIGLSTLILSLFFIPFGINNNLCLCNGDGVTKTTIINYAENNCKEKIIETKFGRVTDDKISKVTLYGTFYEDTPFAKNVRIEICNKKSKKPIVIKPKTDSGYSPHIILANFKDGRKKQIFLGMNSGGSGGFGYYYVYDINGNKVKTIFDYEKWNINYTAKYLDNYKVEIANTDKSANQKYLIDLSLRDKDYLSKIYDKNGKLLKPISGNVSGVNTVFPYFNSTNGLYQLQVLQRITGLYNADGLGYVINFMEFKTNQFVPYYTMVGIN